MKRFTVVVAMLIAFVALQHRVAAQGTAFTYQGRLNDSNGPANGEFEFEFRLFSAAVNGTFLSSTSGKSVVVSNGLFTTEVDFGNGHFTGLERWLEIGVRATGEVFYATLQPRQRIAPTPYALYAPNAGNANVAALADSVPPGSITSTQLAPGAAAANLAASGGIQSNVPSSTIVLSAREINTSLIGAGFVSLGMSNVIAPEAWTNAPSGPPATGALDPGRYHHRAVWTGSDMLVIGGTPDATGIRYNPSANSWSIMNKSNAPAIGEDVHVVWSGSQLVVWDAYHRVGARYNPATDVWATMSDTNSPSAREGSAAAYANGYFVVWGGTEPDEYFGVLNSGARYNVATDSWSTTSSVNAPRRRTTPSAVAVGNEIIFFGGRGTNTQQVFEDPNDPNNNNMIDVLNPEALTTGSRYNPAANTWSAIASAPEGRDLHVAATSGTDMFVLGGNESYYTFNGVSGGLFVGETPSSYGLRYNIVGNSWSVINTNGQPRVVDGSLVWTSSGLVLWGGSAWYVDNPSGFGSHYVYYPTNFGARYVPASDSWVPLSASSLSNRTLHSAVWTGTQMIIWGGRDQDYDALSNGARYNAAGNNWSSMTIPPASGEPGPRTSPSAVWTGDALIVWGGLNGGTALRSGGIYRPGIGWTNTPDIGAPTARFNHTATWTGTEMIIWGGLGSFGGVPLNNGARFNVASNKWFPLPTVNAPRARALHTAVWTGKEMIVWGGYDFTNIFYPQFLNNGARCNPSNNTWITISNSPGVGARAGHTAVWTGNEMLIWGGYTYSGGLFGTFTRFSTGFRYNPALSNWTTLPASGIAGRQSHTAVWNGTEMLVWGGQTSAGATNTGARYHLGSNTWTAIPTNNAPTIRYAHSAVWADLSGQMIVWGGYDGGSYLRSGGLFDPFTGTWQTMLNNNSIPIRARHVAAWTGKDMIIFDGGATTDLNDGRIYAPERIFYLYQKP